MTTTARVYAITLIAFAVALAAAATYGVASSQSANGKYDTDGNGLIEIQHLEQLDAIRYDLDGDGRSDDDRYAAAFPTRGAEPVCNHNCEGYELARPLDFDNADSYASGAVNAKWTGGDGWLPIGVGNFHAIFNGNGYTISNLYIHRTTEFNNPGAVGLFGYTSGSTIRSIGVVNVDVTGLSNVGALVGINGGAIEGSYTVGNVQGGREVGGLVGRNQGTISQSYADGSVLSEGRLLDQPSLGIDTTGGLVGTNRGIVSNSYATAEVSGNVAVGGLVGSTYGKVEGSFATGNVSGNQLIGGLAGTVREGRGSEGAVYGSYATGKVSGDGEVGGLVGRGGTITSSYATGSVSGNWNVGGLAGESYDIITASYATGNVSGENSIGGLVGYLGGIVRISYAIGNVAGDEFSGGLIARLQEGSNSTTVIASYWNTQTSGQATSAAGEGKTTAELQSPTGYTGIYANWHVDLDNADQDFDQLTGRDDYWDFGTSSQYPAIKVDLDGDGVATWHELNSQGRPLPTPTPPAAENADINAISLAQVFEELVDAGLLVVVWHYDNATASWAVYDPSAPAELNDLTSVVAKDIVWVEVTERTQFQGRTLNKGWNLITLR